jgi:phage tail-like protein
MSRAPARSYRFSTAAHWRAGASAGFASAGAALVAAVPLGSRRIPGSDGAALAGGDGCGNLRWLGGDGRVWTLGPFGVEADGRLTGATAPSGFVVGGRWLWAAVEDAVLRYEASTLQWVGEVALPGLLAVAGDGCEGLWAVVTDEAGLGLRRLDRDGVLDRAGVRLPGPASTAAVAAHGGEGLAVMVVDGTVRRLLFIDLERGAVRWERLLPEPALAEAAFLARGAAGAIMVVFSGGEVLGVDPSGALTAREQPPFPASALPLRGAFFDAGLVAIGADGLYRLGPAVGADAGAARATAVFVTPVLISPTGVPQGWRRAEVEAVLPPGVTLRVRVAASDDPVLIAGAEAQMGAGSTLDRLAAVDGLLPWRAAYDRDFRGRGARARYGVLLDGLSETRLWLRLECVTAAGAAPAEIHGLRVTYPAASWLDDLPAIYREDPESARQLGRLLAPVEALFEDLDARIGGLAGEIDPETAPATRTAFVLRWLGYPDVSALPSEARARLLKRAGDLLSRRGTRGALQEVLEIAVGVGRVQVEDTAANAPFWVLGRPADGPGHRLGRDTRAVRGRPPEFRLGAATLRSARIGRRICVDLDDLAARACPVVRIRIGLEPAQRRALEPTLRALLSVFVPAHCRVDLRFLPPGAIAVEPRLDDTLRLADGDGDPLGRTTRPGAWRLRANDPAPLTLEAAGAPGADRRLA